MAVKIAAANIKTAITPLLIHLETYFLGRIVALATKEWIRYVTFACNVCKSNMDAKIAGKTCKQRYNNHNEMPIMMAYNEIYLLHSLSALYTRYTTHRKHFSHYPGRGHHGDCLSLLHHMHRSFALCWSVAQPHLITLTQSRGARAAPSDTVTSSNDFDASSFSSHTLLVQAQDSLFSNTALHTDTWKCARLTFCSNA